MAVGLEHTVVVVAGGRVYAWAGGVLRTSTRPIISSSSSFSARHMGNHTQVKPCSELSREFVLKDPAVGGVTSTGSWVSTRGRRQGLQIVTFPTQFEPFDALRPPEAAEIKLEME